MFFMTGRSVCWQRVILSVWRVILSMRRVILSMRRVILSVRRMILRMMISLLSRCGPSWP